ncbi:MAG: GMC family oxidoreductase [Chitinophagaceae bacterium]|nr:GMC family oxidoreductase [Chitinophagaceae bacterium]
MNKYDLIIVGTGFASSFFLKKYLEKSSSEKKVLVLDRGAFFPYTERLKQRRLEKIADEFTNLVPYYNTYEYDNKVSKEWVFDPNFGGSSNCWTGCTPRFIPNDFKMRSLYGVGQDWPISYDDLEHYYCEVEDIMKIAGPSVTPFPRSKPYLLPPQTLSTIDRLLNDKYGALYISQPTARATVAVDNRGACCTSTVCKLCPVNSKFTIENTLEHLYKDPRVSLKLNTQVFNLIISNNKVNGVVYKNNGREEEAFGEIVALGSNAIFNAHILLSAGDKNYYTGKGLSDQRGTFVNFYFDKLDNLGGSSSITANGYMMYDGNFRKDYAGCIIESFNEPLIRSEAGKWRKIARFKFIFEDLPSDNNRVLPGNDPFKPKLQYEGHHQYVDDAMKKLRQNIDKYFSFLPIEKIEMDNYFQKSEFHICSTTRMGTNMENSVIDKNLIHHTYRNLFVLGSGAFPTITPANPTLTLSALSLMAADKSF